MSPRRERLLRGWWPAWLGELHQAKKSAAAQRFWNRRCGYVSRRRDKKWQARCRREWRQFYAFELGYHTHEVFEETAAMRALWARAAAAEGRQAFLSEPPD